MDSFLRDFLLILILAAAPYSNADASDRTDRIAERELTAITEFIPSLETLDCRPSCSGASGCGGFTDIDNCLNDPQAQRLACFWSCE